MTKWLDKEGVEHVAKEGNGGVHGRFLLVVRKDLPEDELFERASRYMQQHTGYSAVTYKDVDDVDPEKDLDIPAEVVDHVRVVYVVGLPGRALN